MRIYSHAYPVDWSTTEKPHILLENLEGLLPQMNLQEIDRRSKFLFDVVLGALRCEIELMMLKNAPFITVVRVN